jgi:hypothetical protein
VTALSFFSFLKYLQEKKRASSYTNNMRQLKHHEQKLLKKVDFLQWKKDDTLREIKVIRKYFLQQREDYHK